jgi:hypothetical protein
MQNITVKDVKGVAFLTNSLNPLLRSFSLSSNINVMLCLIECKKQKYIVNANKGEK